MSRSVKGVFLLISLLMLVWSVVFVISQTYQVVHLAETAFGEGAGQAALWGLLAIYATLILAPVVLFFRLPRTLVPPEDEASPAFEEHLSRLRTRLKTNRRVEGFALDKREDIEKALNTLDAQAEDIIKETASQVFVSTAISQYGTMDALFALSAQSKMVWQVSHVYYQRPPLREMIQLYANVATTAFVAVKLDEVDISEQVGILVKSALGPSLAGSIPGLQFTASVLTNSIVSGSANAFLALRVGIITRQYCNALIKREKSLIKDSATGEAAKLLTSTIATALATVTKQVGVAVAKGVIGAGATVAGGIKQAGATVAEGAMQFSSTVAEGTKQAGATVAEGAMQLGATVAEGTKQAGATVAEGAMQFSATVAEGTKQAGATVAESAVQLFGATAAEDTKQAGATVDKDKKSGLAHNIGAAKRNLMARFGVFTLEKP